MGKTIFIRSLRPNKIQMDIGINAITANCWMTFTLIMKERNQSSRASANITNTKGSFAISVADIDGLCRYSSQREMGRIKNP